MAITLEFIKNYIQEGLAGKLSAIKHEFGELTLDVSAEHWIEVARFLRHNEMLDCAQLTDLCGVDYLTYGDVEWDVTTASRSGFSRAVSSSDAADPFDFDAQDDQPELCRQAFCRGDSSAVREQKSAYPGTYPL